MTAADLPGYKENPAFLDTTKKLDTTVHCTVCDKWIGAGPTREDAIADAIKREGTGTISEIGLLCRECGEAVN